jgi:hypothetical protein
MKLSELRQRSGQVPSAGSTLGHPDDPTSFETGTIRNAVAYQHPIRATYQGQPVTLIASGDISGMSPAEKFIDENGKIDWAPSDEFVVNDFNVVPQSSAQLQRLTGSGRR